MTLVLHHDLSGRVTYTASTCAPIFLAFEVYLNSFRVVISKIGVVLLGQGLSRNDYKRSALMCRFTRMVYVPSKACSTFTASLALVSKYGIPPFELQKACARLDETCALG